MSSSPLTDLPARGVTGEPFGKYLLLDRIGHGGMAEVFRAVSQGPEGFQRALVIKRILPHLSHDPTFVRMFIDEAKVSGLLSHPNLVQIYEFGKIEDSFFIAMEHVHGQTLTAVQQRLSKLGRLAPLAATVEIGRQICVGLHHAHSPALRWWPAAWNRSPGCFALERHAGLSRRRNDPRLRHCPNG